MRPNPDRHDAGDKGGIVQFKYRHMNLLPLVSATTWRLDSQAVAWRCVTVEDSGITLHRVSRETFGSDA